MTFLPIVDRELRVSARNKATRRLRVLFAVGALVVAGALWLVSSVNGGSMTPQLGLYIFETLRWAGFAFACSAGVFLTADCLSEEKRDGTLGLLFLTDLRGYDVVLGKLLATSLRSCYALLAVFPVMALAFCLGGVASDDFWHSIVAICNALFFSLAFGLMISVLSRDPHKAMTGTLVGTGLFVLFLPNSNWVLGGIAILSPLYAMTHSNSFHTADFWASTVVVNMAAWCFLGMASWIAPASWHDKPARGAGERKWRWPGFLSLRKGLAAKELRGRDPVCWLIARDQWASRLATLILALVLAGLVMTLASYCFRPAASVSLAARPAAVVPPLRATTTPTSGATTFFIGVSVSSSKNMTTTNSTNGATTTTTATVMTVPGSAWASPMANSIWFKIASSCSWVLSFALEFWLASQVCRFYVDARKNGFLELLLVTPVRPTDVLRAHWAALRRIFLPPVGAQIVLALAVGAINLLPAGAAVPAGMPGPIAEVVIIVLGTASWVVGLFTITWYAIWMALKSNRITVSVLKTIVYTKILPWFAIYFLMGLSTFFVARIFQQAIFWYFLIAPQVAYILVSLWLLMSARPAARKAFDEIREMKFGS